MEEESPAETVFMTAMTENLSQTENVMESENKHRKRRRQNHDVLNFGQGVQRDKN
jgi:CRISPR/Cas system CMR subunit Cmr4 (Cas7 group RAMP superfamily)